MTDIYLVREHIAVGDELILTAFVGDYARAKHFAMNKCDETGTKNFDVVHVKEGQIREDLGMEQNDT